MKKSKELTSSSWPISLSPTHVISWFHSILTDHRQFPFFFFFVIVGEFVLGLIMIKLVPYTEIDWVAYMQEVEGFLEGQWDYALLGGQTGHLPYPAGFVYLYAGLYYVTDRGSNIVLAQYIFLALYLTVIAVLLLIYHRTKAVPPWFMLTLCISRRIHSIFMLRLFNDCWGMLFLYLSVLLFQYGRWSLGCLVFSLSVSIKMNVLTFAPALLALLVQRFGWKGTIPKLAICASTQLALAVPFLIGNAFNYVDRAFNFRRKFLYVWTVNLKFLPEAWFLSGWLSIGLLVAHVVVLLFFLQITIRSPRFTEVVIGRTPSNTFKTNLLLQPERMVHLLFMTNFVGIVFCRSIHFQFYVWYYHTLPFLLWHTRLPVVVRFVVLALIELVYNVFPMTAAPSALLAGCHLLLLCSTLWYSWLRENRTYLKLN